ELILNYQEGIKSVTQYIQNEKSLNECDISFIISLFQEFEDSSFSYCYVDPKKLLEATKNVLYKLPDIHELNTKKKKSEYIRETILKDKSLSIYEKIHMSKLFKSHEEYIKVDEPDGINDKIRRCEICQNMTYASQYCEHCIRYWKQGSFGTWNAEKQILERNGLELAHDIILKKLENSSKSDGRWFEEVTSHLSIDHHEENFVTCYGITRDPISRDYILVLDIEAFIKELGDVITKHNRLQNSELRKLIASESSMHISLIDKKSSSNYNFKKLPEPRNATAEEIE
ncbi:26950_t:CDS:2, partial [Racocetra persica]